MPTIAIDFDGVIHSYELGWSDGTIYGTPIPGSLEALRMLMTKFSVFIHTSRNPEQVVEWLENLGFNAVFDEGDRPFWNEREKILVSSRKLPALVYIDDRGLRFYSWDQTLSELSKLI